MYRPVTLNKKHEIRTKKYSEKEKRKFKNAQKRLLWKSEYSVQKSKRFAEKGKKGLGSLHSSPLHKLFLGRKIDVQGAALLFSFIFSNTIAAFYLSEQRFPPNPFFLQASVSGELFSTQKLRNGREKGQNFVLQPRQVVYFFAFQTAKLLLSFLDVEVRVQVF